MNARDRNPNHQRPSFILGNGSNRPASPREFHEKPEENNHKEGEQKSEHPVYRNVNTEQRDRWRIPVRDNPFEDGSEDQLVSVDHDLTEADGHKEAVHHPLLLGALPEGCKNRLVGYCTGYCTNKKG